MAYLDRRFNGEIHRLKVETTEQIFLVHQNILEKSPVLARMITSGFSESITKEITLPENNEDAFDRIIEHFYGHRQNAFSFDACDDSSTLKKLASTYILTDKYELPHVQEEIIKVLGTVTLSKVDKIAFFNNACHIFANIRNSDTLFRAYFKKEAALHLRTATATHVEKISETVKWGNSFAKLILQIQAELYRDDQHKSSKEIASLEDELTRKEKVLNRTEANLSRFRSKLYQFTGKRERIY